MSAASRAPRRRIRLLRPVWVAWVFVAPAQAATLVVNATSDQFGELPAQCTLREAVQAANTDAAFGGCAAGAGSDLILLPAGSGVVLTRAGRGEDLNATGDLDITTSVEIRTADAANRAGIDAAGLDRVLDLRGSGVLVQLARLDLYGADPVPPGTVDAGGLLRVNGATVLGDELAFVGGRATQGGAVQQDASTVAINRCLLRDNAATTNGGAWTLGPGANLTLRACTLSRNRAGGAGGAIAAPSSGYTVLLNNVTVSGNAANLSGSGAQGGGVWFPPVAASDVGIHNSVVEGNTARGAGGDDCVGALMAVRYSAVGGLAPAPGASCTALNVAARVTAPARLLPLADYGGQTAGMHPAPDSPLRDAGNANAADGVDCHAVDQRGEPRGASCDIGALEFAQVFTVDVTGDTPDAAPGDGLCVATVSGGCSLRAAVMESNARAGRQTVIVPGQYTLTIAGTGEDLAATGDLDLRDPVNIFGGSAASAIDANAVDRVFDVRRDAVIAQLDLRNGRVTGADGGVVRIDDASTPRLVLASVRVRIGQASNGGGVAVGNGRLTLSGSTVDANLAANTGGGLWLGPLARVDLLNSAVVDNQAAGEGGGILALSGVFDAQLSTLARNRAGGAGGGLRATGIASVSLTLSLLASNLRAGVADDCAATLGGDFNVIGTDAGCSGGGAGSLRNLDAGLQAGFATWGSGGVAMPVPAIGSPVLQAMAGECVGAAEAPVARDGLGLARTTVVGGQRRCTPGAVQSSERLLADGFE